MIRSPNTQESLTQFYYITRNTISLLHLRHVFVGEKTTFVNTITVHVIARMVNEVPLLCNFEMMLLVQLSRVCLLTSMSFVLHTKNSRSWTSSTITSLALEYILIPIYFYIVVQCTIAMVQYKGLQDIFSA